ncbi:MAG: recombination mediator RecR [Holosporales bacterium]|jgi:recombination protein RecR|nr:recombination mediator RecR [Holosporales bacterium]
MDSSLRNVIRTMARLPGLGPRSAQRAVLFAIKNENSFLEQLINDLITVRDHIRKCKHCGNLDCGDICSICLDVKRDAHQLCIVESVADLWAIERAQFFHGRYHILGCVLSAIDGVYPEHLNTKSLVARVNADRITEVIIALNATIEGQTTTYYIADVLAGLGVSVSSPAHGIPLGGEFNYLDDGTISAAFLDRREVKLSKVKVA